MRALVHVTPEIPHIMTLIARSIVFHGLSIWYRNILCAVTLWVLLNFKLWQISGFRNAGISTHIYSIDDPSQRAPLLVASCVNTYMQSCSEHWSDSDDENVILAVIRLIRGSLAEHQATEQDIFESVTATDAKTEMYGYSGSWVASKKGMWSDWLVPVRQLHNHPVGDRKRIHLQPGVLRAHGSSSFWRRNACGRK